MGGVQEYIGILGPPLLYVLCVPAWLAVIYVVTYLSVKGLDRLLKWWDP